MSKTTFFIGFVNVAAQAQTLLASNLCWCVQQEAQQSNVEEGSITQLAERYAEFPGARLVLVVPGALTTLAWVATPSKQRKHIEQAVPYLLEERLVADIDQYHLTMLSPNEDNHVPCIALLKDDIRQLVETFTEAGLPLDVMVPESWLLAQQPSSVVCHQSQVTVVTATSAVGIVPEALAAQLVPELIDLTEVQQAWADADSSLPSTMELPVEWQVISGHWLTWLSGLWQKTGNVNLLHHEWQPCHRNNTGWKQWRWSIAGVIMVISLGLAGLHGYAWHQERHAQRLEQATTDLYRKIFPNQKKVIDVVSQFKAQLKQRSGGQDNAFLHTLFQLGHILQTGQPGQFTVRSLDFRNDGSFMMELLAKDLASVEQLISTSKAQGLEANLRSANNQRQQVLARIELAAN
ncbi:hypothetical protein KCM76_13420 [Zooshikella marina]|uniref:type II secretion system protein GspL n=1 Tax=Zooshikella ganghwensis TaxID=202772 RepID=UPI001BAF39D0|nr:type II secretion system protein GspL [Zooshikella ganghwensis]MBU2706988.1 hypothetical protein [Zooshikella ganghwensis]